MKKETSFENSPRIFFDFGVIYCHSKFSVGQAPRLYNLPSEYMLQGHRYLDPPILGVQDVCEPSVDIPTPRTHTSNSVQNCAPSPTTTS